MGTYKLVSMMFLMTSNDMYTCKTLPAASKSLDLCLFSDLKLLALYKFFFVVVVVMIRAIQWAMM